MPKASKASKRARDDSGTELDDDGDCDNVTPPTKKAAKTTEQQVAAGNKSSPTQMVLQHQSSSSTLFHLIESPFYNEAARLRSFGKDLKRDKYGNIAGPEGDLSKDSAFKGWKILVCYRFDDPAQDALRAKGWDITSVKTESKFVQEYRSGHWDVLMVFSRGNRDLRTQGHKDFVRVILEHLNSARGLFLAADNDPLFKHVNDILQEGQFGFLLQGDTPGDTILTPGSVHEAGHFDAVDHPITAGIEAAIYEGESICYPVPEDAFRPLAVDNSNSTSSGQNNKAQQQQHWTVLARSSDDHPVIISSTDAFSQSSGKGRVVIDCGFTKFHRVRFDAHPGTKRYLTNALAWLANVERYSEPAGVRSSSLQQSSTTRKKK